jgi:hypothetical protein
MGTECLYRISGFVTTRMLTFKKATLKQCKAVSEIGSDAVHEAFETPGDVIPNR